MEIEVKQFVRVSVSPYCKNCVRKEYSEKQRNWFCGLFNRFIYPHNGDFLKCRECYNALYDAIDKGD